MKHLLLTTIAAVVVVGCGESQQSAPVPEAKPVAEVATPEPTTAKAPDIDIHDAAAKGNIEAVKQHLDAGTDVNTRDKKRRTPLYWAATHGHKKIVELLIANGSDVNAKNQNGYTPLHTAVDDGHKEIVELLITEGADVNAKQGSGGTPLHWAAFWGHKEIAELLIANGADVNAKNKNGNTPLDNAEGETAVLLRKHGGKHGTIHIAVHNDDIEEVKEFLAAGTDVNAKNKYGVTPLLGAAASGHKEIVELLIAKGADVNAIDADGKTPLDWAAHPDNPNDSAETAALLRKHGAKTSEELKAEGK